MCSYQIFNEGSSNHLEEMNYTKAEFFHHSRSKHINTLSSYQSSDSVWPVGRATESNNTIDSV